MSATPNKQMKGGRSKCVTSSRRSVKAVVLGGVDLDLAVLAPAAAIEAGIEAQPQHLYIDMTDPNEEMGVLVDAEVGATWKSPTTASPTSGRARSNLEVPETVTRRKVYLLVTDDGKYSYIGSTTDVDRRLRQHNMDIKGGAWATKIRVKQGLRWNRAMHVAGFSTEAAAYNFEAKWKMVNKKQSKKLPLIERKMQGLRETIALTGQQRCWPVWGAFVDHTWVNDFAIEL